jgi:hypothetical protein
MTGRYMCGSKVCDATRSLSTRLAGFGSLDVAVLTSHSPSEYEFHQFLAAKEGGKEEGGQGLRERVEGCE